jgi:hypothetical protein
MIIFDCSNCLAIFLRVLIYNKPLYPGHLFGRENSLIGIVI